METALTGSLLGGFSGMVFGLMLIIIFHLVRQKPGARYIPSSAVHDEAFTPTFGVVVSDWKRCFAWRPVRTLDEGHIWLRHYWRRRIRKKSFLDGPNWEAYQRVAILNLREEKVRRYRAELWP